MLLGLATSSQASDDACLEKAQTQSQINECAAEALKSADDELNRLYHQMQDRLKNDENTKSHLIEAQRKWLAFRDSECSFTTSRSAGSSMHPMYMNECLAGLTQSRVMELKNHLACGKGASEQESMQCALPKTAR